MPTYEYECQRCGHRFDLFQRITDAPRQRCPKCRGRLQRLLGMGAGVIFKGSGFYATDYRSESYRKAAQSEKGAASASADGASGGSKTKKPAAGGKDA